MNTHREQISMCLIVGLIIYGIIDEFLLVSGNSFITIPDFSSISLALIQAEAVLFGLTISLIALLSGKMDESYLGINYADYILNRKPVLFYQKRIIGFLLIILIASFVLQMAKLYNLVCSLFLCSCILIWISASNIYTVFSGKAQLDVELKLYFEKGIQTGDKNMRIDFLSGLLAEWKSNITIQEPGAYNEYLHEFELLFGIMITEDSERSILADACAVLAKTMLTSQTTYKRGVAFVYWCYTRTSSFIRRNISTAKEHKIPFLLLSAVYGEFRYAITHLPINSVEEQIFWEHFIDDIAITGKSLGYDPASGVNEGQIIEHLGFVLGNIVGKDPRRNDRYWGKPFLTHYFHQETEKQLGEDGIRILADHRFNFICSLIELYEPLLLTNYVLHPRWMLNKMDSVSAFLMLKVYCYLFYLAHYETVECADQKLLDYALEILRQPNAMENFRNLLIYLEEHDKNVYQFFHPDLDVLNETMLQRMKNELRCVEKWPTDGSGKLMIMDLAVSDFVIFLMTYIAKQSDQPELLLTAISDKDASWFFITYIRDNDRRNQLSHFLQLLGISAEHNSNTIEDFYSFLEKCIRERYKQAILESAEQLPDLKIAQIHELESNILSYLRKKLSLIICDDVSEYTDVLLLPVSSDAQTSLQSILKDHYDYLFRNALSFVLHKLSQIGKLKTIYRNSSFAEDSQLFEYLRKKTETHYILGSEYSLRPTNYHNREEFQRILDQFEYSTCGGGEMALLIPKHSIIVNIKDIQIEDHIGTIDNSDAKYNEETGLYSYEVSNAMPIEVTESELSSYLAKARRGYRIIAKMGIQANNDGNIEFEAVYR